MSFRRKNKHSLVSYDKSNSLAAINSVAVSKTPVAKQKQNSSEASLGLIKIPKSKGPKIIKISKKPALSFSSFFHAHKSEKDSSIITQTNKTQSFEQKQDDSKLEAPQAPDSIQKNYQKIIGHIRRGKSTVAETTTIDSEQRPARSLKFLKKKTAKPFKAISGDIAMLRQNWFDVECHSCLNRKVRQPFRMACKHNICEDCVIQLDTIRGLQEVELGENEYKCAECGVKTKSKKLEPIVIKKKADDLLKVSVNTQQNNEEENIRDSVTNPEILSQRGVSDMKSPDFIPNSQRIQGSLLKKDTLIDIKGTDNPTKTNSSEILKTEEEDCKAHKEKLKLFCFNCGKPLCVMCTHYETSHEGHTIKPIPIAIKLGVNERKKLVEEGKQVCEILQNSISQFQQLQESMTRQKLLYIKKLDVEFALIQKIIELRKQAMKEKIEESFDFVYKENKRKIDGFTSARERIKHLSNFKGFKDRDVLRISQRLDSLYNFLSSVDLSYTDDEDLTESMFTENPHNIISEVLAKFDFAPVKAMDIDRCRRCFENSKILNDDLFNPQFVSILPKIDSAKLCYRYSKNGSGTEQFHFNCSNKGPTILLVKANDNYIFGGYNPLSWIKENVYLNTTGSFLFSLTDGKGRGVIKFPVKRNRSSCAIKCSELLWSPGFGEEGFCDLFINFKKIKSSYSKLGNVYECPNTYEDPDTLLAGRKSNWFIQEIEIYSLNLVEDTFET
ncbi:unnamed protein product [Moneuplotes crassus]|uniref:Uncharacterized protein n=1 Tax=Euplotes crassus TaxID=5936 RepID=A0AAD1Y6V2_EUPCR|nr:unnamed protein product [Moneuplotes crassus]